MALNQDSFQDMVLQLQLEDTEQLASKSKGKGREGTLSDAELALQIYTDDLKACSDNMTDEKMAQSMALAVQHDGNILAQEHSEAQQIAQDRDFAQYLQSGKGKRARDSQTQPSKTRDGADIWEDAEMLSKVAAIYMPEPEDTLSSPPQLVSDSDSDVGPRKVVAESSKRAASRKQKEEPKLGQCVACGEKKEFFKVARVPCKNSHEYCRDCLTQLFRLSMTDETLFPPRCCTEPIPLQRVRFFLPPDLAKEFESKYDELCTKNRTYCHDRSCSTFIPAKAIRSDIATCPQCRRTTCIMCKEASHSGDCPEDEAVQHLIDTADANQWQRCYQCNRFVELQHGCNHISCPCGAQFCYVCGARWHTCGCPWGNEERLEEMAARIVDRNPRRRLYQPPRADHAQPIQSSASKSPNLTLDELLRPASPVSQAEWSDHSEWESDGGFDDIPDPMPRPTPPLDPMLPGPSTSTRVSQARIQRIIAAMGYLRDNNECDHEKWRWVRGPHFCDECLELLKEYIFECRQCHLRACNRCRRNRL